MPPKYREAGAAGLGAKLYSKGTLASWKIVAENFHDILTTLPPYTINPLTEPEVHKVVDHVWMMIFKQTGE